MEFKRKYERSRVINGEWMSISSSFASYTYCFFLTHNGRSQVISGTNQRRGTALSPDCPLAFDVKVKMKRNVSLKIVYLMVYNVVE